MPGSSKNYIENNHINDQILRGQPLSKLDAVSARRYDYYDGLPSKCEILKEDREVINNDESNGRCRESGFEGDSG